jgi:putative membrane protein
MKKNTLYTFLLSVAISAGALYSCVSKKNDTMKESSTAALDDAGYSKDKAQHLNDEKFSGSEKLKDARFAVDAADGGLLEVELGNLALTNASTDVVKQFAKHIVEDHSKGNEELKNLAKSEGIALPDALSEKNKEAFDKFTHKSGIEFDKDYIDFMIKDHKEDIVEFEKEAKKGHDPEIKSLAAKTLPTLNHHLEMAQSTRDALKQDN